MNGDSESGTVHRSVCGSVPRCQRERLRERLRAVYSGTGSLVTEYAYGYAVTGRKRYGPKGCG